MISFVVYFEKKVNDKLIGIELCDFNEEIEYSLIGHNSLYPFFGYNVWRSSPRVLGFSVNRLPFITDLSEERSDEFNEYYFPGCDYCPGMFLLKDALDFDYDQTAYDSFTYRDSLKETYFDMLNAAKEYKADRILFYFN